MKTRKLDFAPWPEEVGKGKRTRKEKEREINEQDSHKARQPYLLAQYSSIRIENIIEGRIEVEEGEINNEIGNTKKI